MYICTFPLCVLCAFLVRRRITERRIEKRRRGGGGVVVVEAGGEKIHWEAQVEIVSKTLILRKNLKNPFFFVKYGSDHFSFLTVTMTAGITGGDFTPP